MTLQQKKREYNRTARANRQKRKAAEIQRGKLSELSRKEQTQRHVQEIGRVADRYVRMYDSSPFLGAEKGFF
jgi:hypothetical protein